MLSIKTNTFRCIKLVLYMQWCICLSSYDSTIGDAVMPFPNDGMAVVYDANNDTILLLGGGDDSYYRQFTTFRNNVFTLINQYYLSESQQTWSYSQHYTTLHDELWMIRMNGSGFTTFNINTYKVETPSITIPTNINYAGCLVSIPNYLIVLGGLTEDRNTARNDTQIYDINEDMWLLNVPNMSQKRGSFSCVVVNYNVYAIGGYSYPTFFDTIEVLDISNIDSVQSNEWRYLSGTLSKALRGTRAALYHTDIIVIGGQDEDRRPLTDVHRIDTLTERCEEVGTLGRETSYATCIIVGNTLHIFGGWSYWSIWSGGALDEYQYIVLPTLFPTIYPTNNPTVTTFDSTIIPSQSPTLRSTAFPEADGEQGNNNNNRTETKSFVTSITGILCIIGIIVMLLVCVVIIALCVKKRTVEPQSDVQPLRQTEGINQHQVVTYDTVHINPANEQEIALQIVGHSECHSLKTDNVTVDAPPIQPVPDDSDSDDIVLAGLHITGGAPLAHCYDHEVVPPPPLPPTDNGNYVVHHDVNLVGVNTLR